MSREEKFYQMCTTLPFDEIPDDRTEMSVPELVKVAELRDERKLADAVEYGRALAKLYSDLDLVPFMLSYMLFQAGQHTEAYKIATDAIPKCNRKYRLYAVVGLAEFARNHLPEALVWWSRSIISQARTADFQEADPFMYMASAAQTIEAIKESLALFQMVDAIDVTGPRLDSTDLAKIRLVSNIWVKDPLSKVLAYIVEQQLN